MTPDWPLLPLLMPPSPMNPRIRHYAPRSRCDTLKPPVAEATAQSNTHSDHGEWGAHRDMRLTKEQEELRLAGLRILARLIVRARLASLMDDAPDTACGAATGTRPARRPRRPQSVRPDSGSRDTGSL